MKIKLNVLFLTFFLALFAIPAMADGLPPSQEDVCDTAEILDIPGLYGLCNAYCEAQDCDSEEGDLPQSCISLERNFARKADRAGVDPVLPCEMSSDPVCPCWSATERDEVGVNLPTDNFPFSICAFGFQGNFGPNEEFISNLDIVGYNSGAEEVIFAAGTETCFYRDHEGSETSERFMTGIGIDEELACRDDVILRSIDFDFCISAP